MRTPWLVRLALTLALLLGGFALADPLLTIGGPAAEIDVDTDRINSVSDNVADNSVKLLEALGDFICKLFACGGTGAPQPGGGAGQQPAQVQSILPIPEDWARDPRFVRISGRLPIADATAWLDGLRVARSTFADDVFVVVFEPWRAGQALEFVTFHQAYELPEIVRTENRLDGRYAVRAGTYTVDGNQLKIPVVRLR